MEELSAAAVVWAARLAAATRPDKVRAWHMVALSWWLVGLVLVACSCVVGRGEGGRERDEMSRGKR